MAMLRPSLRSVGWAPTQRIQELNVAQQPEMARLDFNKTRFNEILNLYKNAFSNYGQNQGGGSSIPSYFKQAVDLYGPGGQYGAGSEAAIAQGQQQEIAAGNIASAASGLGSSTTAMARTNAAIRSARNARLLADEERLKLLGGAYAQAGQAGLETQRLDAYKQEALLRSLASLT